MRIAILIIRFLPNFIGGAEIATYNIAKFLAKRGHEVHVITSLDGNLPEISKIDDFFIHRIRIIELPLLRAPLFALKSLVLIKKMKIDILHSQSISFYNAGIAALLIKKFLNIPCVVYGRGSDLYQMGFERGINKIILKNSNAVIVLTNDMKKKIKSIVDIPINVIPNGIDISIFKRLTKFEMREKFFLDNKSKIIIYAGRLHKLKGLRYLIEAMVIVQKNHPNSKLLIIGAGEENNYLRTQVQKFGIEKNVLFIGEIDPSIVPEYLVAADIFVLPSLSEGFPNAVLEAMGAGLPIICNNITGLSEIIENYHNGLFTEVKNSKDLANKILLLINNSELYEKISVANKIDIKNFDINITVEKIESVYNEVLSKCKKQPHTLGVITLPLGRSGYIPFSNLINILESFNEKLYVVTGNEGFKISGNKKNMIKMDISVKSPNSDVIRIINYLLIQLIISYYIVKNKRNTKIWIFFLAEGLIIPMITAKILNKKIFQIITGSSVKTLQFTSNKYYSIMKILSPIGFHIADTIVLYSPNLKNELNINQYDKKIKYAQRHFIDFTQLSIQKKYSERPNIIGYIGRLSEEKGILNFVYAMKKFSQSNNNFAFYIIGDGILFNKIEKYLSENSLNKIVKLLGWISHEEIPHYLNDLKLLVVPSYTEGLPNIILEAMATGTPVLATSVGSTSDLIIDRKNGFILQDNSPESIYKSIIASINYSKIDEIIENARITVTNEYHLSKCVESYKQLLESDQR